MGEKQGPEFMKFLIDQGKIQGLAMKDFKRSVGPVIGYTVALMGDDWKNRVTTGLMSSWLTNWKNLNKVMEQTVQLRAYMDGNTDCGTQSVKHFEISQLLGNVKFEID